MKVDGDHAEPDEIADALAAFGRKVARHFEASPERVSNDARVQEAVRVKLDLTFSECALVIEQAIQKLGAAG